MHFPKTTKEKFLILKATRMVAQEALGKSLQKLLSSKKQISELMLRDTWLKEMRKSKTIFPDGWYIPPPHGVITLFGGEKETTRVSPDSPRLEKFWPKGAVCLDKDKGIVFVYASPVHRETGIIGDFGLTLYFGKKTKICDHIRKSYRLIHKIFKHIRVGMPFAEIAQYADAEMNKQQTYSQLLSSTDKVGTNIGHTIPAVFEGWTKEEKKLWQSLRNDWDRIKNMISKKRIFINTQENLIVKPGMAFTLEPRPEALRNPDIPMVYYHSVVVIHDNGEKELIANFDDLFAISGMNYWI